VSPPPASLGKANFALRGFIGGTVTIALLGLVGQGIHQLV
jgi:hypothetical protein